MDIQTLMKKVLTFIRNSQSSGYDTSSAYQDVSAKVNDVRNSSD